MPYRPRELVVRARDAAALLLAALDRDEMVARFLDLYAAEHRRPGRADHPVLYRDQLAMIRRESILAMVVGIERALPARLKVSVTVRHRLPRVKKGSKPKKKKKSRHAGLELRIPFLELFREEFFVVLGRSLDWTERDAEEFWRDLELYEMLSADEHRRSPKRAPGAPVSGPFVDRVAMLLDPSLMEQARRAAGKFEIELQAATDRILRKTFTRRHGA